MWLGNPTVQMKVRVCRRLFVLVTALSLPVSTPVDADESTAASATASIILAPGVDNPRNSEGDFIQLRDRRILFIYSHYYGGSGVDHDPAYLASRVSSDGGATWSAVSEQVIANEGDQNIMSVSLLRLPTGEIALFYLRKNSPVDLRPVVRFSVDEAKSWSEPVEIIPDAERGYYVVNNDRVIQLDSGRLVVPAASHVDNSPTKFAPFAEAVCFVSDDNGRHWRRGEPVRVDREVASGLQEPGVVELRDGRLLMFCRTNAGAQFFAHSSDAGETWSEPRPGTLPSPLAPASIERIPGTDDLLAVWNNNSTRAYHRTPLTAAISIDDGQSWNHLKNLETDPKGLFCYTAIEFVDDHVLLAYCAGRNGVREGLSTTKITREPLSWFRSSRAATP
jgi:hypothetical protein